MVAKLVPSWCGGGGDDAKNASRQRERPNNKPNKTLAGLARVCLLASARSAQINKKTQRNERNQTEQTLVLDRIERNVDARIILLI